MGSMGWWAAKDRGGPHSGPSTRPGFEISPEPVATAWRCAGSLAVCELWPPAATPAGYDM